MGGSTSELPGYKTAMSRESLSEGEKWRLAVDNTLKSGSLGCIAGGLFSLLAFRSVAVRASITAFGGGFGVGRAYVDTRYVLGHNVDAETVWTAEVLEKGKRVSTSASEGTSAAQ
ncbi:putative protein of unknown function (DUF543) [Trypanosoma vivax]|uniref:MICOS complex subunit MIC10 n=1 Tax=Trypanosoma vivax (strain Y486) TaxID=1055687 RepID=G0U5F6_TRYVY|nr:hypothetical protein TRVL_06762 [Trypanosoma vivax]KAH8618425.1 putative protein of unknown function (DUF543) [Trypanosoma vivax]CCC51106.1 conserved hypothetical protein [Trypanosoma vivax Y486]